MSNHDSMNETELDELDTTLSSPPEPTSIDIAEVVTPWRKSINRVIGGLALTTLTLNFLALDYILPAIGLVLMLLGFRTLRQENKWFQGCFLITIFKRRVVFFNTYSECYGLPECGL